MRGAVSELLVREWSLIELALEDRWPALQRRGQQAQGCRWGRFRGDAWTPNQFAIRPCWAILCKRLVKLPSNQYGTWQVALMLISYAQTYPQRTMRSFLHFIKDLDALSCTASITQFLFFRLGTFCPGAYFGLRVRFQQSWFLEGGFTGGHPVLHKYESSFGAIQLKVGKTSCGLSLPPRGGIRIG